MRINKKSKALKENITKETKVSIAFLCISGLKRQALADNQPSLTLAGLTHEPSSMHGQILVLQTTARGVMGTL